MINEINHLLRLPNKAKIWIELFKKTNHPVFIFSTAAAGISYYKVLISIGVNVMGFADNNLRDGAGKTVNINGRLVPVLSFQELVFNYNNIAYIVIPPRLHLTSIIQQFTDVSFDKNKFVDVDFDVLISPPTYELCEKAYQYLEDDRSREIFLDRLKMLCTGVVVNLKKGSDKNLMYFDEDFVSFNSKEFVIDGGSDNSVSTFKKFIESAKDFNRYYICDHDLDNMLKTKHSLSQYIKIDFVPKGLFNRKGTINLSSYYTGTATDITIIDTQIEVTSIDEIRDGNPATFIKLNIEGAESEALKGGEKTIAKYAPTLAVSAFHKPRDFIDLPILIKSLNPDYKIYLRHYQSKTILNFTHNLNLVCYGVNQSPSAG